MEPDLETPFSFVNNMSTPYPTRSLKLFFWVLGLSMTPDFVNIDDNCVVAGVRKEIVKEMPGKFSAHELILCKVSTSVPYLHLH